jgi:hypothetical protein
LPGPFWKRPRDGAFVNLPHSRIQVNQIFRPTFALPESIRPVLKRFCGPPQWRRLLLYHACLREIKGGGSGIKRPPVAKSSNIER